MNRWHEVPVSAEMKWQLLSREYYLLCPWGMPGLCVGPPAPEGPILRRVIVVGIEVVQH
jgi:hypothetical protein